jgi:1,2-diacylglycerol 3-alpha-glucosyltransferase
MPNTANRALAFYQELLQKNATSHDQDDDLWMHLLDLIKAEWNIIEGVAGAAGNSILNI